jgi:hypothetical protein
MSAWSVIRRHATAGSKPGSIGQTADLCRAVDLFLDVEPFLANRDGERAALNADPDVFGAILMREQLESIGVLRSKP